MHNGFLSIDNEKMSKSLGNFFTARGDGEDQASRGARFFLLSSQYRGPMNYSPDQLDQAEAALTRMYLALRGMPSNSGDLYAPTAATAEFVASMDDDFNTPEAIAVLQGLARDLNIERAANGESSKARELTSELRALGASVLADPAVPPIRPS
jgi:cysteinyl-tRNA synthetase